MVIMPTKNFVGFRYDRIMADNPNNDINYHVFQSELTAIPIVPLPNI